MKGCGKWKTFHCKYQVIRNARCGSGQIRGKGGMVGGIAHRKVEVEVRTLNVVGRVGRED